MVNISTLLETEGHIVLIKEQRMWLNCILLVAKYNSLSDELQYLAKEISKKSVNNLIWLLCAACNKMKREE